MLLVAASYVYSAEESLCKSRNKAELKHALLASANPFFGEASSQLPAAGGRRDMAVLMTLYSPGRWARPVMNALVMQNRLQAQGVPLYVVEVAVGTSAHVFQASPHTLLLRSDSCLFQKERLLNVLEKRVPKRYTKLLLLDGDVSLSSATDEHWYDTLQRLLDSHDVVHPFDVCGRLDLSLKNVDGVRSSRASAAARADIRPPGALLRVPRQPQPAAGPAAGEPASGVRLGGSS